MFFIKISRPVLENLHGGTFLFVQNSFTIPVNDRNLLKEIARKFGWACML